MECKFGHNHRQKEVTYSRDNPQARLYHCPDIPCSNKAKSVPRVEKTNFKWVTTYVGEAESLQFEPCDRCFDL